MSVASKTLSAAMSTSASLLCRFILNAVLLFSLTVILVKELIM